jgi:D-cysteine desulfhydrase family pyridoxal phosphate-dependent enzyme
MTTLIGTLFPRSLGRRPWHLCVLSTAILTTTSRTVHGMALVSQRHAYKPPLWARDKFTNLPSQGRLTLGNFPTPLYQLPACQVPPGSNNSNTWYVKRDDSSGGVELGGNKVRKLEFLLAAAVAGSYDSVITIGGEQSNHCRATAAACRMVGLEPHLILRSKRADEDLGFVGNLLVDRLLQSAIYTCTPGEYGRVGSTALVSGLARTLEAQGKTPYCIPVGGSNGLGTWGYLEGVQEFLTQWKELVSPTKTVDHIVFACGSGGTAAGIALGVAFAFAEEEHKPTVHAIGVCDDPDYFYRHVADIADEMGLIVPQGWSSSEAFLRAHFIVHQGKGLGYAVSTAEELQFVQAFGRSTGIVLDPVYSGKALYNFCNFMTENDVSFRDAQILFWHTGGALGLYDKVSALEGSLQASSPCQRLDVYGKGNGVVDISE